MSFGEVCQSYIREHPVLTVATFGLAPVISYFLGRQVKQKENAGEQRKIDEVARAAMNAGAEAQVAPKVRRVMKADGSIEEIAISPAQTNPAAAPAKPSKAARTPPAAAAPQVFKDRTNLFYAVAAELGLDDPAEVQKKVVQNQMRLLEKLDPNMSYNRAKAMDEMLSRNNPEAQSQIGDIKETKMALHLFMSMAEAYDEEKKSKVAQLRAQLSQMDETSKNDPKQKQEIEKHIESLLNHKFSVAEYLHVNSLDGYREKSGEVAAIALAYDAKVTVYEPGENSPVAKYSIGEGSTQINLMLTNNRYISCTPKKPVLGKDGNSLYTSIAQFVSPNKDPEEVRKAVAQRLGEFITGINTGSDEQSAAHRKNEFEKLSRKIEEVSPSPNTIKLMESHFVFSSMENTFELQKEARIKYLREDAVRTKRDPVDLQKEIEHITKQRLDVKKYMERAATSGARVKYPEMLALASLYPIRVNVYMQGPQGIYLEPSRQIGSGSRAVNVMFDGTYYHLLSTQAYNPNLEFKSSRAASQASQPPAASAAVSSSPVQDQGGMKDKTNLYHAIAAAVHADDPNEIREVVMARAKSAMRSKKPEAQALLKEMKYSYDTDKEMDLNNNAQFDPETFIQRIANDYVANKRAEITALAGLYRATINVYEMGSSGPVLREEGIYGNGPRIINLLFQDGKFSYQALQTPEFKTRLPADGNSFYHAFALQLGSNDYARMRKYVADIESNLLENLESPDPKLREQAEHFLDAIERAYNIEKENRIRSLRLEADTAKYSGDDESVAIAYEFEAEQLEKETFDRKKYLARTAADQSNASLPEVIALATTNRYTINILSKDATGPESALFRYGNGPKTVNLYFDGKHFQPIG